MNFRVGEDRAGNYTCCFFTGRKIAYCGGPVVILILKVPRVTTPSTVITVIPSNGEEQVLRGRCNKIIEA